MSKTCFWGDWGWHVLDNMNKDLGLMMFDNDNINVRVSIWCARVSKWCAWRVDVVFCVCGVVWRDWRVVLGRLGFTSGEAFNNFTMNSIWDNGCVVVLTSNDLFGVLFALSPLDFLSEIMPTSVPCSHHSCPWSWLMFTFRWHVTRCAKWS